MQVGNFLIEIQYFQRIQIDVKVSVKMETDVIPVK